MPREPKEPTRKPTATRLRFVGSPDHYLTGVPRADLSIVETPASETEVTLERARELVATRLYVPEGGELTAPEPSGEEEGATAPEED